MPEVSIRKTVLVVFLVVALPLAAMGVGVAIFGTDDSSDRTTTQLDHAVLSGDLQQMLDRHEAMMEQMRVGATPEMLSMMDADPMWQEMRTGDFAKLMEQHQAQLDRMLGRDS